MHPGDAVTDYLRCFGNGDIDGVAETLADDAVIEGPPGGFRCRDEYVTVLRDGLIIESLPVFDAQGVGR